MQPPDDRHLELLGAITGAKTEGRLGGPVLAIWTFRAKESGTMEAKMHYYRSWEGAGRAGETKI